MPGKVLLRDHCGALYDRTGDELGLDLAGLHAVAPELHLVVGAAEYLEGTIETHAHDVARPVSPLAIGLRWRNRSAVRSGRPR